MKNSRIESLALWIVLWIFILLVSIFSSCTPEKRIARILKKHPELVKSDTIWKSDTIITGSIQKDSTFHFYQKDTIIINNGKLSVKYFFNHDSTVYIQGKCNSDTIIKYYPIETKSVEIKEKSFWDKTGKWIFVLIIVCILVFILFK